MSEVKRIYNYPWQKKDSRDYKFALKTSVKLPITTDLRPMMPPVFDQGALGSCTANALAGVLGYLEQIHHDKYTNLSRLFIYYNERDAEGTIDTDSGAALRDGIKTLDKFGACQEVLWPYNISKFTIKPTLNCYTEALDYKIVEYQALNTLNDMKLSLANGYPFVFGFTVYESFEYQIVASTGIMPLPTPTEQILGAHAVVGVGYDDNTQMMLVRNSWGTSWGLGGYFWMPYSFINDPQNASDFWAIITDITDGKIPIPPPTPEPTPTPPQPIPPPVESFWQWLLRVLFGIK